VDPIVSRGNEKFITNIARIVLRQRKHHLLPMVLPVLHAWFSGIKD
jgi:hypothetical protein